MPITSHGRIKGAPTRPPITARPANRKRVRPNAASVPSTKQRGATTNATMNELRSACRRSGSPHASTNQWIVNPSRGNASTFESLKENSNKIRSGPNSAKKTTARNATHPATLACVCARARTTAGAATPNPAGCTACAILGGLHLGPRGNPGRTVLRRARRDRVLQVERRVQRRPLDHGLRRDVERLLVRHLVVPGGRLEQLGLRARVPVQQGVRG